jgi:glycosyltransferase involved in cell wall biosynthesis
MSKAKMMIVAALEDYGLVPIESNISGTPVIAYGAGGVLDTQKPGVSGLFFEEQTPEALISALLEARQMEWNHEVIHDHAKERFTKRAFFKEVDTFLENSISTMVGKELAST